jgi:hypothetical protein
MSDREMQRIDKPTIYSAFWNAYPAGSHHLWAMLADEASSESRPKIASLLNLVTVEYETAFSWSTATSS